MIGKSTPHTSITITKVSNFSSPMIYRIGSIESLKRPVQKNRFAGESNIPISTTVVQSADYPALLHRSITSMTASPRLNVNQLSRRPLWSLFLL